MRSNGISSEFDIMDRSFKSQMKYSDKLSADFVAIIGEDELRTDKVAVKNMKTGEQESVERDKLVEFIQSKKQ